MKILYNTQVTSHLIQEIETHKQFTSDIFQYISVHPMKGTDDFI